MEALRAVFADPYAAKSSRQQRNAVAVTGSIQRPDDRQSYRPERLQGQVPNGPATIVRLKVGSRTQPTFADAALWMAVAAGIFEDTPEFRKCRIPW